MRFSARISFHQQLAPLLSRADRSGVKLYLFSESPSVKDAIEACGIPHTEVDIILIDGVSVDFSHLLTDGAQVDVYPYDAPPQMEPLIHLCPSLERDASFILDVHLGKLARRLRLLGFDCRYSNDCDDPELIRLALEEQRIILTCDRGILKHARVRQGMLIRSSKADEQVMEVLKRYQISWQIRPFLRCTSCNGRLKIVEKEKIAHRLLPRTDKYYDEFYQCRDCEKLYWKGSHYERISCWIDAMKECG